MSVGWLAAADGPEMAWTRAHRVAFRFLCAYLVLYNLPDALSAVPFLQFAVAGYAALWQMLVPWVGQHLLQLEGPVTAFERGSGDMTFNYVHLLCVAGVALGATVLWSAVDRGRLHYRTAHTWLRVYVRYSLCFTLLAYGAAKVIPVQFPGIGLARLFQRIGDASPMGLLWTFMGYSVPYSVFAGSMEVLAALLLIPRRLTTVGALLAMAVLGNVVMLNFSYDVPVKLYSLHLFLMAAVLVAPDWRRLLEFHALNRPVAAKPIQPLFRKPRHNLVAKGVGLALVGSASMSALWGAWQGYMSYGAGAPVPSLYGIFEVSTFARRGDTLPAPDSLAWRRVVFEKGGVVMVSRANDSAGWYTGVVDTAATMLTLTPLDPEGGWVSDTTHRVTLGYQRPDSLHLTLVGRLGPDSIRAELVRRDERAFLLLQRGFHWINEVPFNR